MANEDRLNDKRTNLDSIIDDVILKPVRFVALEARMRLHLNIYERTSNNTFVIGNFSFLPIDKTLVETTTKKIIHLTEKETMILQYLYLKSDLIIPRDNLLHEVWGYSSGVTTHTLETHIYRLRKKIETDSSNPLLLITEPGGYRLIP
jgi:DNA-binding response OmpR family regulator